MYNHGLLYIRSEHILVHCASFTNASDDCLEYYCNLSYQNCFRISFTQVFAACKLFVFIKCINIYIACIVEPFSLNLFNMSHLFHVNSFLH